MFNEERPFRDKWLAVWPTPTEAGKRRQRNLVVYRSLLQILNFPEDRPFADTVVDVLCRGLRAVSHPGRVGAANAFDVAHISSQPRHCQRARPI